LEGTSSTIEKVYRLEAEENAAAADPCRKVRNEDVGTYLNLRALRNFQRAFDERAPLGEHLIQTVNQ